MFGGCVLVVVAFGPCGWFSHFDHSLMLRLYHISCGFRLFGVGLFVVFRGDLLPGLVVGYVYIWVVLVFV